MGGSAEQRVIVAERRLDLVVAGQGRAVRQHELPCGFALGLRPVRDAMFGDQLGGDLRDARAVLRFAAKGVGAVGAATQAGMCAMSHDALP